MSEQPRRKLSSGTIFIGCMFVGVGIGMVTGARQAGTMIGMGVGFLAMALMQHNNNSEDVETEY